jgi:hypothetical protein
MTMRNDDPPSHEDTVDEAPVVPPLAGSSPQLKAAFQQFIEDFSQHSRKNSELIDVLVQALRSVNQELQQQKLKTHLVDARLKKTEAQLGELARVVDAFRRQGWVQ